MKQIKNNKQIKYKIIRPHIYPKGNDSVIKKCDVNKQSATNTQLHTTLAIQ